MKSIQYLFLSLLCMLMFNLAACQSKEETKSEYPYTAGVEVKATEFTDLAKVIDDMKDKDSMQVVLSAEVVDACQNKGCWMTLKNQDEPVRVTFKDYGFFVPKSSPGHTASLIGTAYKKITPIEELKHYLEDAHAPQEEIDAITEPKEEIVIVADGVSLI